LKLIKISRPSSKNPKLASRNSFVTVGGREWVESGRNSATANRLITMKDSVIETLELTSTRPRTPRGTAQLLAGKGSVISYISEPETPVWKLTWTALSSVKQGLEIGLFLIIAVSGIGAAVYAIAHLVAFIRSDSLTRTITGLLQ
jgi:hypothetical protein